MNLRHYIALPLVYLAIGLVWLVDLIAGKDEEE